MPPRTILTLLVSALALLPWADHPDRGGLVTAAWAQDDDDGDDDGGDDDGGGGGGTVGSGGGGDGPAPVRPRRGGGRADPGGATAPVIVALPERAQGEVVVANLAAADLAILLAEGFRLIDQRDHPDIGVTLYRLAVPDGLTDTAGRDRVRALPSGADADFNHYFRAGQDRVIPVAAPPPACEGMHCAARDLVGWPPLLAGRAAQCPGSADILLGMVDTGLNPDHPTFAGARLQVERLADTTLDPSQAVHGTAVAAILIGDPASRSPGLVPHARLLAVDVFHRAGSDERTDAFALADGIAFLVEQQVRVINLSLAGPDNSFLAERVRQTVRERAVVIVAAAGNEGPAAPPAFPAAWPEVIAVTAVSADGAVYRRANRGDHLDLAAPGVEVWTAASVTGARDKTGTSFAAPFVTAAAMALLERDPTLTPAQVADKLAALARDLGEAGPDDTFGQGLVRHPGGC